MHDYSVGDKPPPGLPTNTISTGWVGFSRVRYYYYYYYTIIDVANGNLLIQFICVSPRDMLLPTLFAVKWQYSNYMCAM